MQIRIPAVLMRGGTSRGIFFHRDALPSPGEPMDSVILRAYGSPDSYGRQIDGVGGATSVTSKVAIIGPSAQDGCDVDYFFGQVDIRRPLVDYTGSCGNMAAAVGPFAIEEGLVAGSDPVTRVRIWQVNTCKRIVAHVPTTSGHPEVEGEFIIDGVPFAGAMVRLEFLDPGGSCARGFLPTGNPTDELEVPGLGRVQVTLADAANPVVFVRAEEIGLRGAELSEQIDGAPQILRTIELVRSHGAVAMGLASSPDEATKSRPGTPKVAFVSPPSDYNSSRGEQVDGGAISLVARIMTMGTLHRTYAITGAIATAAAALVEGSVVNSVARLEDREPEQQLSIGHPSGVMPVGARVTRRPGGWTCEKGVAFRTARRLMEGCVCVPASVFGRKGWS